MNLMDKKTALLFGQSAYGAGHSINTNPYCRTSESDKILHDAWDKGFLDERAYWETRGTL